MQTTQSTIKPTFKVITSFDFNFQGIDADDILWGPSWDYESNALRVIRVGESTPRTERVHIIEVIGYTFPQLIFDMGAMPSRRLAGPADVVEILEKHRNIQSQAPVYALGAHWKIRDGGGKMFLYFDNKQGDGREGRSSHNMQLGPDAPDCWREDQVIETPIYIVVVGKFLRF